MTHRTHRGTCTHSDIIIQSSQVKVESVESGRLVWLVGACKRRQHAELQEKENLTLGGSSLNWGSLCVQSCISVKHQTLKCRLTGSCKWKSSHSFPAISIFLIHYKKSEMQSRNVTAIFEISFCFLKCLQQVPKVNGTDYSEMYWACSRSPSGENGKS